MTLKERFLSWARRSDAEGEVLDRPAPEELSDAYLQRLQQDVDARLKKDIQFTSVSRASW